MIMSFCLVFFLVLYKFVSVDQATGNRIVVHSTTNDPLSSNRQHLSYDVCLEVRGEIIRTVLCCIVY